MLGKGDSDTSEAMNDILAQVCLALVKVSSCVLYGYWPNVGPGQSPLLLHFPTFHSNV